MPDAVVCVSCGVDLRTGKRLQTTTASAPFRWPGAPESAPKNRRGLFVLGQILSTRAKIVVAALLILAFWIFVLPALKGLSNPVLRRPGSAATAESLHSEQEFEAELGRLGKVTATLRGSAPNGGRSLS